MRKFFCPFCKAYHTEGPCVHVKECSFDEWGSIARLVFRDIEDLSLISHKTVEDNIAAEKEIAESKQTERSS